MTPNWCKVGVGTYGEPTTLRITDDATITFGSYCSISNGATFIIGKGHNPKAVTTYPIKHKMIGLPYDEDPAEGSIVVGNDVWFGRNSLVLPGVHIGSGAIIGAGAVVTKNVLPYSIMVGNPAISKGRRFTDEQIAELLMVQWWSWPPEKIRRYASLLEGEDVEAFLEKTRSD